MSSRTTITEPEFQSGEIASDGLAILVMSLEAFVSFPLPVGGAVTIGRSDDCDVRIEDVLASRRHARLHVGPQLAIEDLGSANGTRVRNELIPSGVQVPLSVGESVGVGSTVLVVQAARGAARVNRVWSHRWFETRLRDECGRSSALGDRFAVVRITLEQPVPWSKVVPLINRNVPPPHVFAAYAAYDYELLILEAGPEEAGRVVEAVRVTLAGLDTTLRAGVACYPRDGVTADALMWRANAQVRPREEKQAQALPESGALSPAMRPVHDLVGRAARSSINVLIIGETGVGKEVMAQALHRLSARAERPMLALNCAGLAESLIESELFGHAKGAFTGAGQAKKGLFEAAHGGTLFLDEIGEMSVGFQARLLRVIANGEILPVGSTTPRAVDVRIVAATHRDLEAAVARGAFREDLYYRLNGLTVHIPPLRERREEILELARLFIEESARAAGRPSCALSPAATELMLQYHWPGNIRELKNVIERAMLLCEGTVIEPKDLPSERMLSSNQGAQGAARTRTLPALSRALTAHEDAEKRRMLEALEASTWNQSRAARMIGMHRRTFVAKLDRYDIPRPQKGNPIPLPVDGDTSEDPVED